MSGGDRRISEPSTAGISFHYNITEFQSHPQATIWPNGISGKTIQVVTIAWPPAWGGLNGSIQYIWPNGILFHLSLDFPEIFGVPFPFL